MRTSEFAKLFGVHPNTVRLYEEWGYLPPVPRDASGERVFTDEHVEQMRLARYTLHRAPRSGPRFKEAYKELVWLAGAGDVQPAITQAHKHLAAVTASRERAVQAREFLRGAAPASIAQLANRPLHIHQAAAFIAETVPVLRRWEAGGLIQVPRNPKNNYRTYGPNELGWLLVIQSLRLAGHNMSSCRRLISRRLKANGAPKRASRPQEPLNKAIDNCISLFAEHEQHTREVLEQLHRMSAPV